MRELAVTIGRWWALCVRHLMSWNRQSQVSYQHDNQMDGRLFSFIHYALLSAHYTAIWIRNCSKNTCAIKLVTMKNTDNFHYNHHLLLPNWHYTAGEDEWNIKESTLARKMDYRPYHTKALTDTFFTKEYFRHLIDCIYSYTQ